jgi:hypothetical protein
MRITPLLRQVVAPDPGLDSTVEPTDRPVNPH